MSPVMDFFLSSVKDVSPEFKRLVVDELVKSGKATVIKKKVPKVSKK